MHDSGDRALEDFGNVDWENVNSNLSIGRFLIMTAISRSKILR